MPVTRAVASGLLRPFLRCVAAVLLVAAVCLADEAAPAKDGKRVTAEKRTKDAAERKDAAAPIDAEQAADKEAREEIVRVARRYDLFLGPDRQKLVLEAEPVLRWPNPTRETRHGATFVWTHEGRPEVMGCIWLNQGMNFAFQSLSDRPVAAEHKGQVLWRPANSGVEFKDLSGAPEPADTPAGRLTQMKDLARRFDCRLTGYDRLRLLLTPLYRYKTDRADLVDGALFAYVQGTDPEVILTLEAQRDGDKPVWKYVLTRRSMTNLEADLDGKPIWSVERTYGSPAEPWYEGKVSN